MKQHISYLLLTITIALVLSAGCNKSPGYIERIETSTYFDRRGLLRKRHVEKTEFRIYNHGRKLVRIGEYGERSGKTILKYNADSSEVNYMHYSFLDSKKLNTLEEFIYNDEGDLASKKEFRFRNDKPIELLNRYWYLPEIYSMKYIRFTGNGDISKVFMSALVYPRAISEYLYNHTAPSSLPVNSKEEPFAYRYYRKHRLLRVATRKPDSEKIVRKVKYRYKRIDSLPSLEIPGYQQ